MENKVSINSLWKTFNQASNALASRLGRTNNIVGEYAEHLALRLYGGELLPCSHESADLRSNDGTLYQVKSRKIEKLQATKLNVIRSWDFDFLVILIFNYDGNIIKALEVPSDVAKSHALIDNHQKGYSISTTKKFLHDHRNKDITESIKELMNNEHFIEGIDNYTESDKRVLPIEFIPNDLDLFKTRILRKGQANITIFYNGGTQETKIWNTSKFNKDSNLIHNIRSRKEFRQGKWQESNIRLVKVEV